VLTQSFTFLSKETLINPTPVMQNSVQED
jgi:hypothetical protein